MSGPKKISTPRGTIFSFTFDGGKVETWLDWKPNFEAKINEAFRSGQEMLDSEILRGCSPRVPFRTGMLEKSGTLGTIIGSGEIRWIAPYAKSVYYRRYSGSNGDKLRGGYWFELWKIAECDDVIARIKRKVGGAL